MNADQKVYELFNAIYTLSHRTSEKQFTITHITKKANIISVHSLEYDNQEPYNYTSDFKIHEFRSYFYFNQTQLYKESDAIEKLLRDFNSWPSKQWSDTTKDKVLKALTLALSPEGALPSPSVSEDEQNSAEGALKQ